MVQLAEPEPSSACVLPAVQLTVPPPVFEIVNTTDPVGVWEPDVAATAAVKVTAVPLGTLLGDDVDSTVVVAMRTFWVIGVAAEGANVVVPPEVAP